MHIRYSIDNVTTNKRHGNARSAAAFAGFLKMQLRLISDGHKI